MFYAFLFIYNFNLKYRCTHLQYIIHIYTKNKKYTIVLLVNFISQKIKLKNLKIDVYLYIREKKCRSMYLRNLI